MADYSKDIERIKNPENIKETVYASSPYVLMKVFENDPIVRRLIKAGWEVVPLISKEMKKGLKLPEITFSCFAYILQKVDVVSAVKILKSLFARTIEKPSGFFTNFAAHALRQAVNLPTKPLEVVYTKNELLETLERI